MHAFLVFNAYMTNVSIKLIKHGMDLRLACVELTYYIVPLPGAAELCSVIMYYYSLDITSCKDSIVAAFRVLCFAVLFRINCCIGG